MPRCSGLVARRQYTAARLRLGMLMTVIAQAHSLHPRCTRWRRAAFEQTCVLRNIVLFGSCRPSVPFPVSA